MNWKLEENSGTRYKAHTSDKSTACSNGYPGDGQLGSKVRIDRDS